MRSFCWRTAVGFLLLPAIAPLGCGSVNDQPKRTGVILKGKVTLANRPLPSGTVILTAANGWEGRSPIRGDGFYLFDEVPVGEVKVGVENIPLPPGEAGQGRKYAPIPPRYKDPETSGLTFMVTAPVGGEQEKNIELTP